MGRGKHEEWNAAAAYNFFRFEECMMSLIIDGALSVSPTINSHGKRCCVRLTAFAPRNA